MRLPWDYRGCGFTTLDANSGLPSPVGSSRGLSIGWCSFPRRPNKIKGYKNAKVRQFPIGPQWLR